MSLTPLGATTIPVSGKLEALVADVWRRIADGLDGRWPPWGLPTLATMSGDGPRARVLALRAARVDTRTFVFHADARSDKVREIAADPRVTVIFWNPADGIEARFTGTAVLHREDAVAHAAWQGVSPLRRLASRSIEAPGAPLNEARRIDALPLHPEHRGPGNFAVIEAEVDRLDWLWVGSDDLRRASFVWTGAAWSGAWTVP